jgi:hypothetical protein
VGGASLLARKMFWHFWLQKVIGETQNFATVSPAAGRSEERLSFAKISHLCQKWHEQVYRSERLYPMNLSAQHLIAELTRRHSATEVVIGIDLGDVWSHYCMLVENGAVVDRYRFTSEESMKPINIHTLSAFLASVLSAKSKKLIRYVFQNGQVLAAGGEPQDQKGNLFYTNSAELYTP